MKKLFKKKDKFPTPQTPREEDAIVKDYNQARLQAGELQYQVDVYENELKRINGYMRDLNREAAARRELDKKIGAEAAAPKGE